MADDLNTGEIVLYNTDEGLAKINLRANNDIVWLSQVQMAELFDRGRTTITEYIKNIFEEDELDEHLVCRDFRHTTQHGAVPEKTSEDRYEEFDTNRKDQDAIKAHNEYDIFNKQQKIDSDFEKQVKKSLEVKGKE